MFLFSLREPSACTYQPFDLFDVGQWQCSTILISQKGCCTLESQESQPKVGDFAATLSALSLAHVAQIFLFIAAVRI